MLMGLRGRDWLESTPACVSDGDSCLVKVMAEADLARAGWYCSLVDPARLVFRAIGMVGFEMHMVLSSSYSGSTPVCTNAAVAVAVVS